MDSTRPKRGEIWLVAMWAGRPGEPGKTRPVLVFSIDDVDIEGPDELHVVIPISTSRLPGRFRPTVSVDEGVVRPSVVVSHAIRSVARGRFQRCLGLARPSTLAAVEEAVSRLLGLDRPGSMDS